MENNILEVMEAFVFEDYYNRVMNKLKNYYNSLPPFKKFASYPYLIKLGVKL